MGTDKRVIVVTGASGGLGSGICRVFRDNGWRIGLIGRNTERLQRVQQEIDPTGESTLLCQADISVYEEVERAVAETLDRFGQIDVLINNAAIDFPSSIEDLSVEQWQKIIAVNLNSVFYLSKSVFPHMKCRKQGYIVNISSVAGKRGWAGATAYCASKFALTGFTQALGQEGKPYNIRCSVVYPGGMDTEWHKVRNSEFLQPEHVGQFLLHLSTQADNFVVNEAVVSPLCEKGYP